MWGTSGNFYWARRETGEAVEGIVVIFVWMSSQRKNLMPYVRLYGLMGWNSLICHAELLNLFFPEKAASLALGVIHELLKEIQRNPRPVVFVSFSGGSKACMYKIFQMIEGKCEMQHDLSKYQPLKDCLCGLIYDSSPVDFTSDLGTRFVLHPNVLKMNYPPTLVTWLAKALASSLDALFLGRFEAQRAEYWQTLYSSANVGPVLVLCSEDDELAPYQIIHNFAQRMEDLGGDVTLTKWSSSSHVGHYKNYPDRYRSSIIELLRKASVVYLKRVQRHGMEPSTKGSCNEVSKSVYNLHKAAMSSNESLRRVAVGPSDHFFLPSSVEYYESRDMGSSMQNEPNEDMVPVQKSSTINAQGVLGRILFEECVPRDVEGWDIMQDSSFNKQIFPSNSMRKYSVHNPIRCMRRLRL